MSGRAQAGTANLLPNKSILFCCAVRPRGSYCFVIGAPIFIDLLRKSSANLSAVLRVGGARVAPSVRSAWRVSGGRCGAGPSTEDLKERRLLRRSAAARSRWALARHHRCDLGGATISRTVRREVNGGFAVSRSVRSLRHGVDLQSDHARRLVFVPGPLRPRWRCGRTRARSV